VSAERGAARLPIVGVMGSGLEPHEELAAPLGTWIARSGYHLLTGGGGGVMETVARAFCAVPGRRGLSIGIIRAAEPPVLDPATGRRRYRPNRVNDWLEVPIHTHLHTSDQTFASRNHINVLTADALVVLPGDSGTDSELRLAAQYGRRVVLFLGEDRLMDRAAAEVGTDPALAAWVTIATSLEQVTEAVREILDRQAFAERP
jgi:predicted Rossmann-fold nucleotide-binding protein